MQERVSQNQSVVIPAGLESIWVHNLILAEGIYKLVDQNGKETYGELRPNGIEQLELNYESTTFTTISDVIFELTTEIPKE